MSDDIPDSVHGRSKDFVFMVYQAEAALQLIGMRIKDTDLSASDIPFQKPYGYNGETLVI